MPAKAFLRAIDPKTEQDLLRTAFDWRPKRPRRGRIDFADFAADDPNHIVLGLFNDELQAVYFFHQTEPDTFQSHFTSSRKADKALVLAGARQLVEWFMSNNLTLTAYVEERNWPIRRFVEAVGFTEKRKFTDSGSLSSTTKLFVEYGAQVNGDGSFGQKTENAGDDGDNGVLRLQDSPAHSSS